MAPRRLSSTQSDTAPCVGCGLCCDGTLYTRARAEPEEESRIEELGLELVSFEGVRYFRLPCAHYGCGQCTIYDQRFARCRSFRCALLRRYQDGEISLGEARDKVETARQLVAGLAETDPLAVLDANRSCIQSKLQRDMEDADETDRPGIARRFLRVVALQTYLERWFLNKRKQTRS